MNLPPFLIICDSLKFCPLRAHTRHGSPRMPVEVFPLGSFGSGNTFSGPGAGGKGVTGIEIVSVNFVSSPTIEPTFLFWGLHRPVAAFLGAILKPIASKRCDRPGQRTE